jgi:GMP synthase-like glutamine amidotransferase
MRTLILQHSPTEIPGTLLDWHRERSRDFHVHLAYAGGPFPSAKDHGWLVILGGPMNLDEEAKYPWLREEKAFLRDWLAVNKPVLGICLGGQLLAQALGARVGRNELREVGFHEVRRTPEQHPAFRRWPSAIPVYQYHEDTFALPPGAQRLAESPACANQAFALGRRAVGLQFHPESTHDWIRSNAASITKGAGETWVQTPAETEALTPARLKPMTEAFFNLLDDFSSGW